MYEQDSLHCSALSLPLHSPADIVTYDVAGNDARTIIARSLARRLSDEVKHGGNSQSVVSQ